MKEIIELDWTKQMNEIYDDIDKHEKEIQLKNKVALEFVKQNIDYDIEILELDCMSWNHIDYIEIEKTDYKSCAYPNSNYYIEKGNSSIKYLEYFEDCNNKKIQILIYQTCGYTGDDYSGFLLYPLTNNKYWKISFEC